MNLRGARSLRVSGTMRGGARIAVNLTQGGNAERPTGAFSVAGLPGGAFAFTPSLLQTTKGWASVTGIGRWPSGRQGAVTLLAEQADPLAGGRAGLALLLDGRPILDDALATGSVRVRQAPR